jgi:hypothetical protein
MTAPPILIDIQSRADLAAVRAATAETSALGAAVERTALMSHSTAIGLSELTRGMARVAESAQLSAFAMREFTGAGFRLAELLGPAGQLIPVLALAGFALYEFWSKSSEAAKKAEEQFQKTIETLAHGTLAAAASAQQFAYSGDPMAYLGGQRKGESNEAYLARSQGLRGVQGALAAQGPSAEAAQQAARADAIRLGKDFNEVVNAGTRAYNAWGASHEALITEQRKLQTEVARTTGVTDALLQKEKELAAFKLSQMQDKVARQIPTALPLGISESDLSLYEAAFGITSRGREQALGVRGVSSIDLIQQARDAAGRVPTLDARGGNPFGIRAARISPTPFETNQVEIAKAQADMDKELDKFAKHVEQHLGSTLADSLAAGITAGFSGHGIKGAFKAAGDALLSGLGGVFIDLGKTYLEYGSIMEALTPLLANPFSSAAASLGIGAGLIALGAALNGVAQREASGGAGNAYTGGPSSFLPAGGLGGGGMTVIIQTVDPNSRTVTSNTLYEINRSQLLNTPVIAPPGRPG